MSNEMTVSGLETFLAELIAAELAESASAPTSVVVVAVVEKAIVKVKAPSKKSVKLAKEIASYKKSIENAKALGNEKHVAYLEALLAEIAA